MTFPVVCFLIHCRETADDPPGRTELIRQHFAEHGIEPIWIRGVHGRSWGLDTRLWHHRDPQARDDLIEGCRQIVNLGASGLPDADLVEEVYRRVLCGHSSAYRIDAGHVGLCLSHWLCWQMAWLMNLQEVLICEDDVQFASGFRQRFDEHRTHLPADWQIWYVGALNVEGAGLRPVDSSTLIREVPHGVFGTHCMLIRRSALPVLMERCCEARTHIDALMMEKALPQLRCYASCATLASQHSADGTWPHAVGGYA